MSATLADSSREPPSAVLPALPYSRPVRTQHSGQLTAAGDVEPPLGRALTYVFQTFLCPYRPSNGTNAESSYA